MLAKFALPALTMIAALLLTSVVLAASATAAKWPAWAIAGGTALTAAVLAAISLVFGKSRLSPRKGGIGFFLLGLGGALFLSTSGLTLPASIPTWVWMILGIGMATVGLIEDADTAQSTPRNRL
ncbi:hypothetical protein [Sinomonas susongensis]|uniref:hypothetical protein n=1 Tax=Sinomonas susongensis TaxID=1324851 RepID=UPI0011081D5D|nr:hypothetical protein [Sinomonas susongensis]